LASITIKKQSNDNKSKETNQDKKEEPTKNRQDGLAK